MSVPVTVQVYPYRSDAEIAVVRLAADGINSAVRVDDEGGLNPGFYASYGVRVEVDVADLEDAYRSLGIERFHIPRQIVDAMYAHCVWAYPREGCGLLALDDDGEPRMVFCLTNAQDSAHRFTIDPAEHFGCVTYAEARGWTIGGVFHSHVRAEAQPSPSDIDGGGDPEWLNIIIGPMTESKPQIRGFRFPNGSVAEVVLSVEP